MLTLSRAALLAATLCLSAPVTMVPAMAQETQEAEAPEFGFSVEIPTVTAVDSSMSESQIRELFTSKFLDHADALARLTATSITIPELTLNVRVDGTEEDLDTRITYRDLVLSNIRDGYAESLTAGASETVSAEGTSISGGITQDGFDIRRTLELVGVVQGDPSAAMKPLYNSFEMVGGSMEGELYSCTFGGQSGTMFEARPLRVALTDVIDAVKGMFEADEPSPEGIGTFVSYATDFFRAFRGGASRVGAIACEIPGDVPVSLAVGGLSADDFEPGIYPNFNVSDIAVDAGELGTGSLGEFVLKRIDLNPTLDTLDSAGGAIDESWFEANWRALIPAFEGMSLSGFAIDAINPEAPEGPRVEAKVGSFDLTLGNYVLGIPTDVAMTASGVEVPLPEDSEDPQLATLLAAGLTTINLGSEVSAAWDEANSAIAVRNVALSLADLGSMAISANIGNATEALFAVDQNVAMNAAFGLTVKEVVINVTDDGIGEIVWPIAAAEQGVNDIEAFRSQMAGFAEGLALQLLGSNDAARQLGIALSDFVTGRNGGVSITVTAKDPNGIPMAVFIAAQDDPTVLMGQVDVRGAAL